MILLSIQRIYTTYLDLGRFMYTLYVLYFSLYYINASEDPSEDANNQHTNGAAKTVFVLGGFQE